MTAENATASPAYPYKSYNENCVINFIPDKKHLKQNIVIANQIHLLVNLL